MSAEFLQSLFGLDDQVAVVIGATGELGGAIAQGLARAGARIVVAGRSEARGATAVERIAGAGGRASFVPVDVTSRDSIESLCKAAVEQCGQVDMLVNCAGMNASTPYLEIPDDQWDQVLITNLRATHVACQAFIPRMLEQPGGGSILNIGSVTARIPLSRVFAYAASKAAVVNLTQNLAREYAPRGIRVNVICPGFFPAEQNRKILDQQRVARIMDETPMGRFGEPHELVGAALLMLSRAAGSYLTGAELYVDGGFTAARF